MADKRMFNKAIIDSDAFLDMPLSSQVLYFHLSMRADDDGFVNNPKSIMRNVRCNEDDMKLLIMKKFILIFDSGVIVIKHWRIHNYIRKDTYKETNYKEEKNMLILDENKAYKFPDPNELMPVDGSSTQYRLDKNRLDKNRLDKISLDKNSIEEDDEEYINNTRARVIDSFISEMTRPITPIEMQIVGEWIKDYSADLVLLALREAVTNGKRSFKYIEAILIGWKNRGIRTVIEAQQAIDEFNYHKSMMNADEDTIDELMLKDVSDLDKKRGRLIDLDNLMDIYAEDEVKYNQYKKEKEALEKELMNDYGN